MGRPGLLCPLCPDSRVNRRFTVENCSECQDRFCIKHITDHEGVWICRRCLRKYEPKATKKEH